jgi:hypothetical protein
MSAMATTLLRDRKVKNAGPKLLLSGVTLALALSALPSSASADQLVIKRPGLHPNYTVELEPHLLLFPFHDGDFGAGVRASFEIVDNGFIPSINNTVGIGTGLDWGVDNAWVPIVLQWNFWLSRNWSVFGEPGVAVRLRDAGRRKTSFDPIVMYAGGRFHFSENITLTMRLGRPTMSVGVSFLF